MDESSPNKAKRDSDMWQIDGSMGCQHLRPHLVDLTLESSLVLELKLLGRNP